MGPEKPQKLPKSAGLRHLFNSLLANSSNSSSNANTSGGADTNSVDDNDSDDNRTGIRDAFRIHAVLAEASPGVRVVSAGEAALVAAAQPVVAVAAPMRPLYDARIEDLGDGDFLRVECVAAAMTS